MSDMVDIDGVRISKDTIKEALKNKFRWPNEAKNPIATTGFVAGRRKDANDTPYRYAIGVSNHMPAKIENLSGYFASLYTIAFFSELDVKKIIKHLNSLLEEYENGTATSR